MVGFFNLKLKSSFFFSTIIQQNTNIATYILFVIKPTIIQNKIINSFKKIFDKLYGKIYTYPQHLKQLN